VGESVIECTSPLNMLSKVPTIIAAIEHVQNDEYQHLMADSPAARQERSRKWEKFLRESGQQRGSNEA
jgi:hypothetical protein